VRVLLHLLAFAAGAGTGLLGAFGQQRTSHGFPVGLLVGLGLTVAVYVAMGHLVRARTGPAAAFIGWMTVTVLVSSVRPGSDTIIPNNARGNGWLYLGLVVAFVAIVLPYAQDPPAPAAGAPSDAPTTGR